jgi:4'-phosphopantetheinyl transferase EntD
LNYKNDNFTAKSIGMPEFSSTLTSSLPETHVCVWKIEEPLEFFQQIPTEWTNIQTQNQIKCTESLAARYCLYDLCRRLGLPNEVLKQDERDRPFFANSDWKISLTHAYPYVAAACRHKKEVGIDIEKKGRKIEKIAPRFLNQDELQDRSGNHSALTLAWSIKESIYKAANIPGLSFREAIALEKHTENTSGCAQINEGEKIATYVYEEFDDFVISLALLD